MSPFTVLGLLITLAALSSYVNHRFIGLPNTAALMLLSLLLSVGFIVSSFFGLPFKEFLENLLLQVDFSQSLLGGVLAFLLFAGALNIDLADLHEHRWRVFSLGFVTTLLSVALVAGAAFFVFRWLGLPVPLLYCLLFGAIISPTDPIAVLGLLKTANAPASLRVKIAGESLFNDGVGVVVFLFFLDSLQTGGPSLGLEWRHAAALLLREAGGGLLLGLVMGWITFQLIKSVDDYRVEILLTLSLVSGGYALAIALGMSGPLAIATAGIVVGNPGRLVMSERTRLNLDTFWDLVDEILNALLFVVVGLQVVALKLRPGYFAAALAMVPVVLLARLVSVGAQRSAFTLFGREVERGGLILLTWGGLRGAISVAMALSLPGGRERDLLLVVTYVVVAFSILVQGTTIPWLLGRMLSRPKRSARHGSGHLL
jgi:CPA1 family monovalent cation:H+ antiporter